MTKKKKQKGKVVPLQSAASYIKTRVRILPIGQCYALENWEEAGMSMIIVSRKHVTGNVTFGSYLVDLSCLGVKDVFYAFNENPETLEGMVETYDLSEIDYVVAHNIIYGAIEFAGKYGFKPHKDWGVGQYILEPDDEKVPLIDIEFGQDGEPVYMAGPYDSEQTIERILATLERTAGAGNYGFVSYSEEADDFFDEEDELFSEEEDELFAPGEIQRIVRGEQEPTLHQQYAIYIVMLMKNVTLTPPTIDQQRLEREAEQLTKSNVFSKDDDLEETIEDFRDQYDELLRNESPNRLDDIRKLRFQNPDNPYIYFKEYTHFISFGMKAEGRQMEQLIKERFPDFIFFDFVAAIAACEEGRPEDAAVLLKSNYISEAFPGRSVFSSGEYEHFCIAWCEHFVAKKMFSEAICYANMIVAEAEDGSFAWNAILRFCNAIAELIPKNSEEEA